MKRFFELALKFLTGAIILCYLLAFGGVLALPITLPIYFFGGEEILFNISDTAGIVILVWIAACILYTIGSGVWLVGKFIWKAFKKDIKA